jgi:hypothetical protein
MAVSWRRFPEWNGAIRTGYVRKRVVNGATWMITPAREQIDYANDYEESF